MATLSDRTTRAGAAILGLAPAVFLPGGLDRFTLPKVAVATLGAALVLAVPARPLPRRLSAVVASAAALCCAAAVAGASPLAQLWGRAPRYEGLIIGLAYLFAFLAGTRVFSAGRPDLRSAFTSAASVATMAVASIAMVEATGLDPLGGVEQRPSSLIGNATEQGAFGVVVLGYFGWLAVRTGRNLHVAAAVGAACCVITSGSRAALVAAVITIVLLAWVTSRPERKRIGWATAAAAAAALALPATRDRLLGTSPLSGATVGGRVQTWEETWDVVSTRPLGVGPSGFVDAIAGAHQPEWFRSQPSSLILDSPHNVALQLWSAGGPLLLALVLLLGWFVGVAGWTRLRGLRDSSRTGRGDDSAAAVIGLPGYVALLFTHFTGPTITPLALLLAGAAIPLAADRPRQDKPQRKQAPVPSGRVAAGGREIFMSSVAALVAAVLGLAAVAEIPSRFGIERLADRDSTGADSAFESVAALRPWAAADLALTAVHGYAASARNGDSDLGARGVGWVQRADVLLRSSPSGLADAASVVEASGNLPLAEQLLTQARSLAPTDPQLMLQLGVVVAERGDHTRAESLFLDAAAKVPTSPDPWRNLAVLYNLIGDTAKASDAAQRAADLAAPPK